MHGTILYYPTINICDGEWLRSAILYWDNVSSIVPVPQYNEENSPEIEWLQKQGLYYPVYPYEISDEYRNKFYDRIHQMISNYKRRIHVVQRNLKDNDKVKDIRSQFLYADNSSHIKKYLPVERGYQIHRDKIDCRKVFDLHASKLPDELIKSLCRAGIAYEDENKGPWLNMDERFAIDLMSVLATYLAASHTGMSPGTDDEQIFDRRYCPAFSCARRSEIDAYVNTKLLNVLPAPRMDVSYEEIIDFKNSRKRELDRFGRIINDYERDLMNCNKLCDIDNIIHKLKTDIENASDEITELMQERKLYNRRASFRVMAHIGVGALIDLSAARGALPPAISVASHAGIEILSNIIDGTNKASDMLPEFEYLYYAQKDGLMK